ncbi:MAG: hypothetical protein LBS45_08530 [Synergistaceae bacterium]|nr:hypothetical protein [Synergistaceae bacterium]
MKILKVIISALFTLIVFLAGAWFFAPWESGGLYTLDKARLAAAGNGWFLSYNGFESSGVIFPEYRIRSLDVESQFIKTSLADVTIKVLPLSSILSGAPTCYVEFSGGGTSINVMESVLKDIVSHEGGRFWLTLSGERINVARAFIGGDVQVTGDIGYNRSKRTLTDNTLLINVPENINVMMKGLGSQYVGKYLEAGSAGEWRIKENAVSN